MPKYEVTLNLVIRKDITIVANAANEDDLKKNLLNGKYETALEDEAWAAYRIDLSNQESTDFEIISAIPLSDNEEEL